jgi:hypothetical protein
MDVDPGDILERTHWDYFWVPDDVEVTDRPELLYYSCPRNVPVLNSVLRTRANPRDLPGLIEEVVRAHSGRRSRWFVRELPATEPLQEALASSGYAPSVRTFASAIDTGQYTPRAPEKIVVRQVSDMPRLRDCVSVMDRAFPGGRAFTEEELELDLRRCTGEGTRVRRFVACDAATDQPLSSGGLTLFPSLRFGLLWAGGTIPEARGRGAYSAVVAARVRAAREAGLSQVGLYAVTDTSAPIVARQGFKRYGGMTYWERECV